MITAFWTLHFHWMYSPRTSRQPETGNLIAYCKDRLTPHSTCHALRMSLFALPCFPWVYNGLCGRVVSFSRSTSSIVGARNERTAFRSGSPRGWAISRWGPQRGWYTSYGSWGVHSVCKATTNDWRGSTYRDASRHWGCSQGSDAYRDDDDPVSLLRSATQTAPGRTMPNETKLIVSIKSGNWGHNFFSIVFHAKVFYANSIEIETKNYAVSCKCKL